MSKKGPEPSPLSTVCASMNAMSHTAISPEALRGSGVPLVADGGVRYSGDICKAIAAGADAVGNRRDGPVRALARTGQLHAREVFVHALAAGLRIKADIEVEAHVDDEECRFCAALVHAFWHTAAPKRCTFTKG